MNITCKFDETKDSQDSYYRCIISDQQIFADEILNIFGSHIDNKLNTDVVNVLFRNCDMVKVPQGLTKIFPKMKSLEIYNSNLKKVKKEDLVEYKLLEQLLFPRNQIEFLPADLLDGFENLKMISFDSNKLKIIEPNLFDGLLSNDLAYVSFKYNENYSILFNIQNKRVSLNNYNNIMNFKNKLNQIFYDNFELYKTVIKKDFEAENDQSFINDIKTIVQDDAHKDFKVLIEDREFHVHKFILAARSPTLAEILKNNPEVENLNLHDIPVDTFEIILNYMYERDLPKMNEYNQLSLFVASGRLKIEKLMNFAATHFMDQINNENAFDILKLSNKYEHHGLKKKSFDIIKKKYPKLKFKDEWIEVPETVRLIIDKFEVKEEAIRKTEEVIRKTEEAMRKLEEDFENERANM